MPQSKSVTRHAQLHEFSTAVDARGFLHAACRCRAQVLVKGLHPTVQVE